MGRAIRLTAPARILALNPHGLVPVLVDEAGPLWESNSICRYLAGKYQREDLLPRDPRRRALVEQWMDWQAGDFNNSWNYAFLALVRKNPSYTDPEAIRTSLRNWTDKIALLESQLELTGANIVGAEVTLADILLALSVNRWLLTPQEHGDFPAVRAYHQRLAARPAAILHAGFDHA